MDLQQIKAFIDAMASTDLAEMECSRDGWTLRLVRRPGAAAQAPAPAEAPRPHPAPVARSVPATAAAAAAAAPVAGRELQAPLYGVVHLQPGPGEAPYVSAGQAVYAGQTVCVIEAMKVFNEVRAEHDGVVDRVLVGPGEEVEAGQALLRLR